MIIEFYDNSDSEFETIKINENDLDKLKLILKEYQKDEDYCWDGFLDLLGANGIYYTIVDGSDEVLYF